MLEAYTRQSEVAETWHTATSHKQSYRTYYEESGTLTYDCDPGLSYPVDRIYRMSSKRKSKPTVQRTLPAALSIIVIVASVHCDKML